MFHFRPLAFALITAATAAGQALSPGHLLVATRRLNDPDFSRSVVLLIWADRDAAIGILINRPPVAPPGNRNPKTSAEPPWIGGPVPLGWNALVRTAAPPAKARRLLPDVYLVSDRAVLPGLPAGTPVRVYAGTCGWTMEQLAAELRDRRWRVLAGRADIVFDEKPETVWERLEKEGGAVPPFLPARPPK